MSGKQRSKDEFADVNFARNKLDGVLQTLAEQKDNDDALDREDFLKQDLEVEVEVEEFVTEQPSGTWSESSYSPLGSPFKRSPRSGGRQSRKRKSGREDLLSPDFQSQQSYVTKLFDRSVDLAKFSEDTPLYPVCRAWIKNDPQASMFDSQSAAESESTTSDTESSQPGCVYTLPPPRLIKQEGGDYLDLRVPSPLPQSDEQLDINADPNEAPEAEMLLINHMIRWKQVRLKWKNAARLNEMLYDDSLRIIKELYDRQNEKQNSQ